MPSFDEHTALIVVDVQNDFADPEGNLYVDGGETIVDGINREIAAARAARSPVIYTQDWHPETTPHFQKDGGVWPVHCVADTWGAEFHQALEVEGPVVRKGTDGGDGYSGFSVRDPESGEESATELRRMLDEQGIERVVVTGLALDVCVKETVLDARDQGYDTVLIEALTKPVDLEEGDGQRALEQMREAGAKVEAPT